MHYRHCLEYACYDSDVSRYRIDLKMQHIEYDLFMPQLDIRCQYNVLGKVLILPITGSGEGVLLLSEFQYEAACPRVFPQHFRVLHQ
jgi:hypothetical protein